MKSNSDFTSNELFSRINHQWMFFLLCGLGGALLSFFFSLLFFKTSYISFSQISVNINFKEIGHLNQYEQDQHIGLVEALFLSDDVVQDTLASLAAQNVNLSKQEFLDHRLVERKANIILLKYVSKDKNLPQIIVTTWTQTAFQSLSDTYQHAATYQSLMDLQNAYESCFQNAATFPAIADCSILLKQLPDTQTIWLEKQLSKGLFPGLTFFLLDEESSPPQEIRYQTNALVLAGFFTGLMFALILLLFVKRPGYQDEVSLL
jgi:hypothetical protein